MIGNKMVYEVHKYAWSGGDWVKGSIDKVCKDTIQWIEDNVGFLRKGNDAAPLFVTEFGADEKGENEADKIFLACFMTWLAQNDLDWALWSGQGSYYLRDGKQDAEETYGILDSTWEKLRSQEFYQKLGPILQTLRDPFSSRPEDHYSVLCHPMTGNCGVARPWCLRATRDGQPVRLTDDCTSDGSLWDTAHHSPFQLASKDEKGDDLCLAWNPDYSGTMLNNIYRLQAFIN